MTIIDFYFLGYYPAMLAPNFLVILYALFNSYFSFLSTISWFLVDPEDKIFLARKDFHITINLASPTVGILKRTRQN